MDFRSSADARRSPCLHGGSIRFVFSISRLLPLLSFPRGKNGFRQSAVVSAVLFGDSYHPYDPRDHDRTNDSDHLRIRTPRGLYPAPAYRKMDTAPLVVRFSNGCRNLLSALRKISAEVIPYQ